MALAGTFNNRSAGGLQHYMLVAKPSLQVAEKLAQSMVDDQAGVCVDGLCPYVTITEFLARQEMEETIIRWMQRITSEQHSFTITLNNYSGYPGRSVFVRIQDHQPFHVLAAQLQPIDDYIQRNNCPPANFILQPNLPLADHLDDKLYDQLIGKYAAREFHESFEVTELMLVCTEEHGTMPVKRAVLKLQPALAA